MSAQIIDFSMQSKIFPGAVIVLKGIVRGKVIPALVYKIHEPGVIMTDVDGIERVWKGALPVIDAVMVDRRLTDGGFGYDNIDQTEGEVKFVTKIAWDGDVRANNRNALNPLPESIVEFSPRYIAIGELQGV